MAHDYDPCWDYPVIDLESVLLPAAARSAARVAVDAVVQELAPQFGFDQVEVFFVEAYGLSSAAAESVGVYVSGTCSSPVVGLDLALIADVCEAECLEFSQQVSVTVAHELAHAFQESLGVFDDGLDEDSAEAFARSWVHDSVFDSSCLHPAGA